MHGAGLFPKIKWLLLGAVVLLVIIWRGAFLGDSLCLNVDLLSLQIQSDIRCIDNVQARPASQQTRVIWLRGYNLWALGNLSQAIDVWQQAPQYAAAMLTTRAQHDTLMEASVREKALTRALMLDPETPETSEIASLYLFTEQQWESVYTAFTAVVDAAPENAVAKAALALADQHLNQPEDEVLRLIDEAVIEAPDNIYVLRYGLRLIQMMPHFGAKRTANLTVLAAAQLPQDFEFTFGIANAYRTLGDYEKAVQYNLMALAINPDHPWANLQQVELLQRLDKEQTLEPWLQRAIDNRVKDRPDYYYRLLAVLIEANSFSLAEDIYCEALEQDIQSEFLLQSFVSSGRVHLEDAICP